MGAGVRHFVVSSGSRSSPLVVALGHFRRIKIWTNPDERSAAFFALGIGKALRVPAALICTSGTAAANYYPAIIEAHMSHTPLLILTADRPARLRGKGAPQTIDQVNLYAEYPSYFADLPALRPGTRSAAAWQRAALAAFSHATTPPRGPAHLNLPFDEPLLPKPKDAAAVAARVASTTPLSKCADAPTPMPTSAQWAAAGRVIAKVPLADQAVVIAGPL